MFKRIWYVISILLGISVFLNISKKNKVAFKEVFKEDIPNTRPIVHPLPSKALKKNLNMRQKDILKLLRKRKVLLPSDIYSLHPNVSTRTLRRDMTTLVNIGLVLQEGNTKDTKYILVE